MLNDVLGGIKSEAIRQYPKEACGLVLRSDSGYSIAICKNVAENPNANFVIDPHDYAAAADTAEVVGVWHTHVEIPPIPSKADRAGCSASELPWYIISIYKEENGYRFDGPTETTPDGFETPYLERPFVESVFDCFSLVRDYYKREYKIVIKDYPRRERDGTMGHTLFADRYEQEGFVRVSDNRPEVGDIFVIHVGGENHLSIYIGNNMIMHHARDRLSKREIYGGMWAKHTVMHLRYKDMKNAH